MYKQPYFTPIGSDSRVALMSGKVNNVLNATMVIFKRMTSPSDLFPKNPRPKSVSDKEVSKLGRT